jgi:hypothetical protein
MEYVLAWHQAIDEFNSFGTALTNPKNRIDTATAKLMFGFKAGHGPGPRKWNLGCKRLNNKQASNNFPSG